MAGSENQKYKLLYLYKILMEETDEDHVLTTPQLIEKLAAKGIRAERKSIYADLEALRNEFGVDIVDVGRGGHYVGERTFEFPEVKSMNSSVYYSVDTIASAIDSGCKVSFRYFTFNAAKEKQYHHEGQAVSVSPYDLVWDNEYYYLIAYDGADRKIKHYRIDRMERIKVLGNEKREGADLYDKADVRSYSKRMFSMFAGEETAVTLRFADKLAAVFIDRFGSYKRLVGCYADISVELAV